MKAEDFSGKIKTARTRVSGMQKQYMEHARPPLYGLLPEAFQELNAVIEELQTADEEMRVQNEELTHLHERVQAERLRYQNLFDYAPDGYIVTDMNGAIREANQAASRMLGIAPRYLIRKPITSLVIPEDVRALRQRLLRSAEMQGVEEWEVRLRPRHAAFFPASLTVTPFRDGSAAAGELRWLIRDITARKWDEAQARSQNAELEQRVRERTAELEDALRRERKIAETLQRSLLQTMPENQIPGLSVATLYEAALDEAQVGGDFYDVFRLDGKRVALVVGDVSGKGLEAAASTAEIKYALRAFLYTEDSPAKALTRLNDFLYAARCHNDWNGDVFVTLALAVYGTSTGETTFSTAGAEPPLLVRQAGQFEVVKARGALLGIQPEASFIETRARLAPGETVLMVTDGITEARAGSEFLGLDGLCEIASEASAAASLRTMGETVLQRVKAFAGGALRDDACILLARRPPS